MEWMILASLAPGIARLIGEAIAAGDYAQAEALRQKAMQEYDVALPDLKEIEAIEQQQTEMRGVQADARYTGTENDVLGRLMKQATTPGLTDSDQADIDAAQADALGFERGVRGAADERAAARGTSGAGYNIASSLAAQQGAINRAHSSGMDAAKAAQERRLRALASAGDYATGLKRDDVALKSNTADAQDRINRFNTEDRRYTRDYNAQLPQQQYDNTLRRADRRYDARRTRADDYEEQGDKTVQTAVGIGDAVGSASSTYGTYGKKKK